MSLDFTQWRTFAVSDIFYLYNGRGITKEEVAEHPGTLPAIQSGECNNGCIGRIDKSYCKETGYEFTDEPCLTVARSGSAGFVGFQPFGCVVGDSAKLLILKENTAKTTFVYLFLRTILEANRYKYTYGRKVTECKYLSEKIMLPATPKGEPNWAYMEQFIKTLNYKQLSTSNKGRTGSLLAIDKWKEFSLDSIFYIEKGKRLTAEEQKEGGTPYIGAIDSNNGVANYIGQTPIHEGNTISLSYNGSVGEAFYQPFPFWATDDVNVLYFRAENGVQFNCRIALFICTILRQEKYRYSYGRKWTLDVMRSTKIKLPIDQNGKPDWAYMESYIKSLPFGDKV